MSTPNILRSGKTIVVQSEHPTTHYTPAEALMIAHQLIEAAGERRGDDVLIQLYVTFPGKDGQLGAQYEIDGMLWHTAYRDRRLMLLLSLEQMVDAAMQRYDERNS